MVQAIVPVKGPVSFADIERRVAARKRGEVSDPSTQDPIAELVRAATEARMKIDYVGGRLDWVEPWMLDPPDSYPFVEWDDLGMRERAWVLGKRVAWAVEQLKTPLEEQALSAMTFDLEAIPDKHDDQWDATRAAAERLRTAIQESAQWRRTGGVPVPARKGHLMAEGQVLGRVRGMLKDRTAYERKVQFLEPVNAFTMLYNDRVAQGGDMLTACTTTDTVEHQITDHKGGKRTVYTAKAVSV